MLPGNNPGAIPRGSPLAQQEELLAVPPGLPSFLLERRPDIRAAEENLVAQGAFVSTAKKVYFPRISLSDQLSSLFTGPSRAWTFVPQVTQPLFTGGRLKSDVKFAKAQQQLALIQYQQRVQSAFREVSDALVQYRKFKEIRTQQNLLVETLRDRSRSRRQLTPERRTQRCWNFRWLTILDHYDSHRSLNCQLVIGVEDFIVIAN